MRVLFLGIFISLVGSLFSGCSHIKISKLTSEADYKGGLRYYRSEPYLSVTRESTKEGAGVKAEVIYLPNKKEEYVIEPKPGLGTLDFDFALENGWNLTGLKGKADSKVPETIAAIMAAVAQGTKVMSNYRIPNPNLSSESPKTSLEEGLYQLVFDEDTGQLRGLRRVAFTLN